MGQLDLEKPVGAARAQIFKEMQKIVAAPPGTGAMECGASGITTPQSGFVRNSRRK
jgi:hypothetical protein